MFRIRAPRPLRFGLALVASVVLLALFARSARGEEAIVLDNGAVLRGTVVHEDATSLVFKLSGVGSESRITIALEHVAQRFVTVDPKAWATGSRAAIAGAKERAAAEAPTPTPVAAASVGLAAATLPEEEPEADEEGFFHRTARRAEQAFPTDPGSRSLLAALAVVVLLCLVGLGGKLAELDNLTLGKSTLLALFLGGILAVDVSWGASLFRADKAAVVLPIELLVWVGCSAAVCKCGFARAFQLLGFVLLAGSLVTFSTGAVLVLV